MTRTLKETAREFNIRHHVESVKVKTSISMWNIWNVTWGHWALTRHLSSRAEAEIELPSVQRHSKDSYEVRLVPHGSKDDEGRCP